MAYESEASLMNGRAAWPGKLPSETFRTLPSASRDVRAIIVASVMRLCFVSRDLDLFVVGSVEYQPRHFGRSTHRAADKRSHGGFLSCGGSLDMRSIGAEVDR